MCKEFRPIAIGLALFAMVSASMGCPSHAAVSPPIDATDAAASCASACANLRLLGCPEGDRGNCAAVLTRIDQGREIRTASSAPLTCAAIASASSVAALQSLGVECGD